MNTKVIITAEDQTGAGIASVKSSMDGLGVAAQAWSGVLKGAFAGLASALSVGTFANWIKSSIDAADSMNDLSQRLGIAVRDLGTWSLAAAQSGTSMATIAQGVKSLSGFMARHSEELRNAGITASDANGALIQLSDLFVAMPDGIEKTALATKLFGRSGAELIPLLNGGSVALKELKNKSADYAAQLNEMTPLADKFNDLLAELELQTKTTGLMFSERLIGPMTEAVELFKDARSGADGFHNAMKRLHTLTDAGPLSIFATAAALSEKGGAAHRAAALAGTGNDEKKRSSGGLIPGGQGDIAARLEEEMRLGERNMAGMKARGLLDKAQREAEQSKRNSRPFDPEGDLWFAIEEAQHKKHRAALNESDKAMDRNAEAMARNAERIKDGIEPLRVLARQIEEVNALRAAGNLTADEASEAEDRLTKEFAKQREAALDLNKSGKDSFKELSDAIQNWGNKAADTFAEFIITGKASFSDLINSMLMDIARLQAKKMLDPITQGANDWLSGLFGGSSGGAGSMSGNGSVQGNAAYIWDLHSGGIAGSGEGSGQHLRNLAMFVGAPKYHGGGLAGDEVPAVLKRGEGVFTPGQMRALGGSSEPPVVVNVTNNFAVGIAQTVRAEVMSMMPQIQAVTTAGVIDARRRGGYARAAFKG